MIYDPIELCSLSINSRDHFLFVLLIISFEYFHHLYSRSFIFSLNMGFHFNGGIDIISNLQAMNRIFQGYLYCELHSHCL